MQMSQTEWAKWSQQRIADAPKIAKLYELQGRQVQKVLLEQGCLHCDPYITMDNGEHGGPLITSPQVTHEMFCPNN